MGFYLPIYHSAALHLGCLGSLEKDKTKNYSIWVVLGHWKKIERKINSIGLFWVIEKKIKRVINSIGLSWFIEKKIKQKKKLQLFWIIEKRYNTLLNSFGLSWVIEKRKIKQKTNMFCLCYPVLLQVMDFCDFHSCYYKIFVQYLIKRQFWNIDQYMALIFWPRAT